MGELKPPHKFGWIMEAVLGICGPLIFIGIIIGSCMGMISCEDRVDRRRAERAAVPLHAYGIANDYKVKVLHITEGLDGGKYKHVVVNCVVEGSKTDERRLIKLDPNGNKIPVPGETWKIVVELSRHGSAAIILGEPAK